MEQITLLTALELVGLGLLIGAVSPTFGIGGGLLTVPVLILLFGFSSVAATSTSLGVILFSSVAGSLAYIRERRIDYRVAVYFMICAVPGSVAGGLVSEWLRALHLKIDIIQILFAAMLTATAIFKIVTILLERRQGSVATASAKAAVGGVGGADGSTASREGDTSAGREGSRPRSVLSRHIVDRHGKDFSYEAKLLPGVIIAFAGGFLGAILGLGGGVIYVAVLTMALGLPAAIATATSTFTILFVNPFALVIRLSTVRWSWVLLLAIGVVVSATLVPRILHKVQDRWLLIGFWTLAILAAIRLILNVAGVRA